MNSYSLLNNPNHVFVIAEAGSNWKCGTYEEDLKQAEKLIQIASESGADAVKFQTFSSEKVYVPNAGKSDYLQKSGIENDINEIFSKNKMPYEMIPELEKICKQNKIMFMSTPFSVEDVEEVDPYVDIHKIASYEINHVRLLETIARKNKPIIVSTGASSFTEIDFAVDLIRNNNNKNIALLQCTSKYPANLVDMNLLAIEKIKNTYHLPVGLSDHSVEPLVAPLIAIGLGATVIEKHFTINKNLEGPDHAFSLEPDELKLMVRTIREAEKTKGDGNKQVLSVEEELKRFATRSLQATKDIEKGEVLQEGVNFDVLRSGNRNRGLDARFLNQVNGKKSKEKIMKGDGIIEYE